MEPIGKGPITEEELLARNSWLNGSYYFILEPESVLCVSKKNNRAVKRLLLTELQCPFLLRHAIKRRLKGYLPTSDREKDACILRTALWRQIARQARDCIDRMKRQQEEEVAPVLEA